MSEVKYITRKELEEHDESADHQWTLIDNLIVDITEYKHQHPGGDEILLEHAGADGTDSFNNVGHSKEARETMKSFVIGELHPDDRNGTKKSTSTGAESESAENGDHASSGGVAGMLKYVLIPAIIFGAAYFAQRAFNSSH